jgi:hypothetical protein
MMLDVLRELQRIALGEDPGVAQAAVKQVAAMLQQRIEQQRQLFGTLGS